MRCCLIAGTVELTSPAIIHPDQAIDWPVFSQSARNPAMPFSVRTWLNSDLMTAGGMVPRQRRSLPIAAHGQGGGQRPTGFSWKTGKEGRQERGGQRGGNWVG